MNFESYFYNCSEQYLDRINEEIYGEIGGLILGLPIRESQAEINRDLFWMLASKNWAFDTTPPNVGEFPPIDLRLNNTSIVLIRNKNNRTLCLTSSTLGAKWHSDFAKIFGGSLVQIEVQFGKVEAMFKDFCGFKIAHYSRRLGLGIEIVISDPMQIFSNRKSAISGMANFKIAKQTLPAINLDCPILLIGIKGDGG